MWFVEKTKGRYALANQCIALSPSSMQPCADKHKGRKPPLAIQAKPTFPKQSNQPSLEEPPPELKVSPCKPNTK